MTTVRCPLSSSHCPLTLAGLVPTLAISESALPHVFNERKRPMKISESDRLALRQELERVFNNPQHAETLMQSLPTTENTELATRSDLERLGLDLRREIDLMGRELRAELHGVRAEIKGETAEITRQLAVQFRYTLLMQMGVLLAVISIMAARG